jgi:hypothetical protein
MLRGRTHPDGLVSKWETQPFPTVRHTTLVLTVWVIRRHSFRLRGVNFRRLADGSVAIRVGAGPLLLEPQADADIAKAMPAFVPVSPFLSDMQTGSLKRESLHNGV